MKRIKNIFNNLKINKQLLMTICGVFLLLLMCGGITFAIFNYSNNANNSNINSGYISFTYTEPSNQYIVENALPMKDGEAMGLSNYFEFSVTTTAKTNENDDNGVSLPYEITITESENNTLNSNQIKMYLTEVEGEKEIDYTIPTLVSNLEPSLYKDVGTKVGFNLHLHRNGNETITTKYRLRAWIDYDVDATNWYKEDKYEYKFRVNVNGEATYQGYTTDLSCFNYEKNVLGTYTIWGYNFDKCDGKNIIVPSSIPEVTTIAYKEIKSIVYPSDEEFIEAYKDFYFENECSSDDKDLSSCLAADGATIAEFEQYFLTEYNNMKSSLNDYIGENYYDNESAIEEFISLFDAMGLTITVEYGEEKQIEKTIQVKVDKIKTLADVDYGVSPATNLGIKNKTNNLNNIINDKKEKVSTVADEKIYVNSVILPDNIEIISSYLFEGLEVEYIYDKNGNFPKQCFEDGLSSFLCSGVKNIRIPSGISSVIGESLFRYKSSTIDSVVIPNDITEIKNYAFAESGLKNITFGSGLTKIGKYAFQGNNLTSVTIPNSVKEIGQFGFQNNKIINLTFGNNVATIGEGAFQNNNLTKINFVDSITTIGNNAFSGNDIETLEIPSYITTIGAGAFSNNKISKLTLPENITAISNNVFSGNKLKEVNLPDTLISIGDNAFSGNDLIKIEFPNSLTTIGANAFAYNDLTELIIPDNVTSIGGSAFVRNKLKYVKMHDNLTLPYARVFLGNKIEKIENENGETPLSCYIYNRYDTYVSISGFRCRGVDNLTIQGNIKGLPVTTIGNDSFKGETISNVIISENITTIGNSAFSYSGLKKVVLPKSLTSIEASAFANNSLTTVTIPGNVERISSKAFEFNKLEEVILEEGIKYIYEYVFQGNEFSTITIPKSVSSLGYSSGMVFNDCPNLRKIINLSGRSENWSKLITGISGSLFTTGTVTTDYGDVEIVTE